ncbi:MAG: PorP/SprF family type IX secretion system membrane protein [Bacteroidia bacterium]|nr:PorP/SprF family type IX secretion system membrane protein [Bacteroidia bacterium]
MNNILLRIFFYSLFSLICLDAAAQQLPIFTQFPSDMLYFNPAFAGTKRQYDVRINYRNQWVGMPDAPITEGISLNYKLDHGAMGLGGYVYQDVTGPTTRNDYTLCYGYHIKFPDLVLSFGAAFSMMEYTVNGSKITTYQPNDPAIDYSLNTTAWAPDASGGLYLYNDRYAFSLSVDNLAAADEKLYKKYMPDTTNKGVVQLEPHFYGYLSYNFAGNANYIWQSSLFAAETYGAPIYLAYSLRVHCNDKYYIGASFVLHDAVSLDLGLTIHNSFEVCYSYDLITSPLNHYTSGTQELTLIFSAESLKKKRKGDTFDQFQKRKYKDIVQ